MKDIKLLSDEETKSATASIVKNEEKNSKVFHYTSVDTLTKLFNNIENHEGKPCFVFHASDIFSQNDAQEVKFGFEQLSSILAEYENLHSINNINVQLSKYLEATTQGVKVRDLILDNLSNAAYKVFTLSFSQLEDDLNMWHLYGDACGGVALQFNEFDLKRLPITVLKLLQPIEYGDATNSSTVLRTINSVYQLYRKELDKNTTTREMVQLRWIITISDLVCSTIKHESFRHEEEKRLIIITGDSQYFKYKMNSNKHLIPYIEVRIPVRYLEKITLGPCADTENLMRVLEMMKITYSMNFQISNSETPYRKY